jgi:CSLREA domain-containing protein
MNKEKIMDKFRLMSFFVILAMLFSFANVSPAHAAVGIVVNSDADIVADDGFCTLREAITAANSDSASGATFGECAAGVGADSIIFAADYTITLVVLQLPVVTSELTITGNGAANSIVQGTPPPAISLSRVFQVASTGNLTLDGITVRHGRCTLGVFGGDCVIYNGGGIYNAGGTLTVTNSALSGNTSNNGGGIYNEGGAVTVTNSTLSGNSVGARYGGGIYNEGGTLTVTDSTISGNSASGGGGIYNVGGTVVTVTNSTLSGNLANYGGGITNDGGTLTVTDSTLSGNTRGGAILNNSGTLIVTDSTISGNSANSGGGGITNLWYGGTVVTVTNSTISGNSGTLGGGIYNAGSLTVADSTITGNYASSSISSGGGGGIYNDSRDTFGLYFVGTVTLNRSLVSGNSATRDGYYTGWDEVYNRNNSGATGTITADEFNVFGHSGENNTDAFFAFTPGASDFNATSDGGTPTALTDILDTTLAGNGGPTFTHALVAGSPAIDFAGACGLATDQRGVARPQGAACDAGAFEVLVTNQPPTADAGGPYEGLPNNAIALSGASASDDDGDPLSYSWMVNSSNCAFSDATALNPTLTCSTDGDFTVTLTVDDGTVMTNDSATVTVITAQEGAENLQSDIQSLVDDEILKTGQAKGLLTPLDNAISSLDKGNVEDACNQLNDFIVKVDEKTPTPLDAATAAGLIDSAEALKSSIGCQ